MVDPVSLSTPQQSPTPETTPGAANAELIHHERLEERLEHVEHRWDNFALVFVFLLGAAMAIGLVTATGHVTW
jgi:hypothetical protein